MNILTTHIYQLEHKQGKGREKKIQKQSHGYPSFPVMLRNCFQSKQPRNHLTDVYQSILETTGASEAHSIIRKFNKAKRGSYSELEDCKSLFSI